MTRTGKDAWLLFAGLWLVYGATIDRADLFNYSLQQAVVESLVERGTYAVGDSQVPQLNDKGDAFLHDGRWLPSKQPGQATLGAAVYGVLEPFGITYRARYFLAASLVTWLTASLLCAIAVARFHLLVTGTWGFPRWAGLASALALGLGTILFPYAGVAHHDVIAASFLLLAFCLLEGSLAGVDGRRGPALSWSALAAGLLIGLTLFTSMLPAALAAVLAVSALATRRRGIVLPVIVGMLLGLAPLAAYDTHYFGSPFVQANIAGGYSETFPGFDPPRLLHHVNAYLGSGDVSVLKYMPIVVLGAIGIFLMPPRLSRPRTLLIWMAGLQMAYVLSLPYIGACQYGPRLLLPAVPFAMLGLPALLARPAGGSAGAPRALLFLAGAAAFYSFLVSAVGALCGTMFCDTARFAFLDGIVQLPRLTTGLYPLWWLCAPAALVLGGVAAVRALVKRRVPPGA